MKQRLIRYTTKPGTTDENERLIRDVFEELAAKTPAGVRYLVLKLDGGGFAHFVMAETEAGTGPLTELETFRAFQKDVMARCIDPPQVSEATVVGNYRVLGE
jgi:hypothetical protein